MFPQPATRVLWDFLLLPGKLQDAGYGMRVVNEIFLSNLVPCNPHFVGLRIAEREIKTSLFCNRTSCIFVIVHPAIL